MKVVPMKNPRYHDLTRQMWQSALVTGESENLLTRSATLRRWHENERLRAIDAEDDALAMFHTLAVRVIQQLMLGNGRNGDAT